MPDGLAQQNNEYKDSELVTYKPRMAKGRCKSAEIDSWMFKGAQRKLATRYGQLSEWRGAGNDFLYVDRSSELAGYVLRMAGWTQ